MRNAIGNDNVDIQTDAMKRSLIYNLGTNHKGCSQHFLDKIYLPSTCTPLGMGLICTLSPSMGGQPIWYLTFWAFLTDTT